MKLLSKFGNAALRTLNWAFNNSSQAVDPTRLRLIDATPLHSSGLRRLTSNKNVQVGLISFAGAAAYSILANPESALSKTVEFLTQLFIFKLLDPFFESMSLSTKFGKNHKNLCFNTKPSEENFTKPEHMLAAEKKVRAFPMQMIMFGFASTGAVFLLRSSGNEDPKFQQQNIHLILIFLNLGFRDVLVFSRFKKVADRKWTIEDAPPPKKTKTIEEKTKDALQSLLPAPAAVPATVPA